MIVNPPFDDTGLTIIDERGGFTIMMINEIPQKSSAQAGGQQRLAGGRHHRRKHSEGPADRGSDEVTGP